MNTLKCFLASSFRSAFLPERKFSSELYKSSWKIDVDAYRSWLDIPESDCCRKLMIKDERCDKGCFIWANILNSFVFTWITSAWFVKAVSFAFGNFANSDVLCKLNHEAFILSRLSMNWMSSNKCSEENKSMSCNLWKVMTFDKCNAVFYLLHSPLTYHKSNS